MTTVQDLVSSKFEIIVPNPGETLRALVVHPTNAELRSEAGAYLQLKLPRRKVKALEAERKTLEKRLNQVGYNATLALMEQAAERWREIVARRAEILTLKESARGDERRALLDEWQALNSEIEALRSEAAGLAIQRRKYGPLAARLNTVRQTLDGHHAAIDREKAYQRAREKLTDESHDWHDIVVETLTQLGFCYRFHKNGKEYTRRIKIASIRVALDAVWLKVHATQKGLFGWSSKLPRGVNPIKLIEDETLGALTVACERQVEGIFRKHAGVWFRINRLGITDGIVERVTYDQIMATYGTARHEGIPIPIGIKQGLEVCWAHLDEYPHLLIAGSSGSGKSNLIKVIINTIISRQPPSAVRLSLVDLKEGTEFAIYQDHKIPHLLGDCIITPPALLDALTQLELLRVERSEKLRSVYATSLSEYNERVPASARMERIVVIIDEFSAIYMTSPFQDAKENQRIADRIKALVRQLLAKARAAGIQLIICTQSPYVEILPGIDKANVAMKVCGRFLDKSVSRAILGVGAAAEIPEEAKGRMIVQTSGQMFMVQTPLVSPEDRLTAIQASHLHTDAVTITLPELPALRPSESFTREELIQLALDEMGGKLSVRPLWVKHIKETGRISLGKLETMVKDMYAKKSVLHDGVTYDVVIVSGGGFALKARDNTPAVESDVAEIAAQSA